MKQVIDFEDDDCVWLEVSKDEHDQLTRGAKAFRDSSIVSPLVRQASIYKQIIVVAEQHDLLPGDWNYRRKRADATRLYGTVHEYAFGLPVRVT